jgi:hypothetical protein
MKRLITLSIALFVLPATKMYSQFVSAEIRPRAEYRNGYKKLRTEGTSPIFLVSQRSRLSLFFQKNKFETGLSFQDIRIWGDGEIVTSTGVFGNNASVDLNEAWIKLNFLKNSSVKIGRQYFDYDDSRLLSNRNWNQNSLPYDALLYQFSKGSLNLDLALSYNNTKNELFYLIEEDSYPRIKTLNFLHIGKSFGKKLQLSGIILSAGYENIQDSLMDEEKILLTWTYGLYLKYYSDLINLETSLNFQHGENHLGYKLEEAYNFNILAKKSLNKIQLHGGYSLISGNNKGKEEENWFNLFYGARHKYYGLMDYFSNLPVATSYYGLQDFFLGIGYKLNSKISLNSDLHYFSTQFAVVNSNDTPHPKRLGFESDSYFKINLMENISLQGGFSFFKTLDNAFMKVQNIDGKEVEFSHWAWLMITAKPVIFKGSDNNPSP